MRKEEDERGWKRMREDERGWKRMREGGVKGVSKDGHFPRTMGRAMLSSV